MSADSVVLELDRALEDHVAYQSAEIDRLTKELEDCMAELVQAESIVAECLNKVSAARGLVRKRLGKSGSALEIMREVCGEVCGAESRRKKDGEPDNSSASVYVANIPRALSPQRKWKEKGQPLVLGHIKEIRHSVMTQLESVGIVYSNFSKRFEAPRQSFQGPAGDAVVVLQNADLVGGKWDILQRGCKLWLLYWLDRNAGFWRENVRPPRAKGGFRIGLFATRSPHRPTPVGLTLCNIKEVDPASRRIYVTGVDVLDETPLITCKPYCAASEACPGAKGGWNEKSDQIQPLYYDQMRQHISESLNKVDFTTDKVMDKLKYLDSRSSIDIFSLVKSTLARHRSKPDETSGTLPVGAYRVQYIVHQEKQTISVTDVVSGIKPTVMANEVEVDPEVREHLSFIKRFPR